MRRELTFDDHVDAFATATARLAAEVDEVGLDQPVPTCPEWATGQLVAHTGMVHRWATAALHGEKLVGVADVEEAGMTAADPVQWFRIGAEELELTLRNTAPDADLWFFLPGVDSPRDGWARRQSHETTIHAADALAARLNRPLRGDDLDISPALAADGVDEMLCSFAPRSRSDLALERETRVSVLADDTGDRWTLVLGPDKPVATRGLDDGEYDARWSAPAADLYLGLWNRGGHITQEGDSPLAAWHSQMRVQW